jgi:hypothetical protein
MYASMIANMDMNIGRILNTLARLNIEENTFVFFTSDNGPEYDAGSPGPYQGRKRFLTEGGIRVPAIVQWKGKIAASSKSNRFAVNTDVFPTLIDVIGHKMPSHVRVDGLSMLPMLLEDSPLTALRKTLVRNGDERVVLWYTHCIDYPKFTAAWSHGYKLLWNDYEGRRGKNMPPVWRVYDMVHDELETTNLLPTLLEGCKDIKKSSSSMSANSSVIQWKHDQSNSTKEALVLFLRYLQLEMHFFKYEGELDWLLYHDNKPAVTSPTCVTRTIYDAESLGWGASINLPHFCGESLMMEQTRGCSCTLEDCSAQWTDASRGAWTNPTFTGLTHFAPVKGSRLNHLKSFLQWTKFQDLCTGVSMVSSVDSLSRSSEKVVSTNEHHACVHNHWQNFDSTKTLFPAPQLQKEDGKVVEYSRGDFFGSNWDRLCHARVHFNIATNSYYPTVATCAYDTPLRTLNHPGMSRPLNVCPESFSKLFDVNKQANHVDDTIMLAALHWIFSGHSKLVILFSVHICSWHVFGCYYRRTRHVRFSACR